MPVSFLVPLIVLGILSTRHPVTKSTQYTECLVWVAALVLPDFEAEKAKKTSLHFAHTVSIGVTLLRLADMSMLI